MKKILVLSWVFFIVFLSSCITISLKTEEKAIKKEVKMGEQINKLPNFDKMWDWNNPKVTEEKFRELLPTAEKSGDKNYYLQLLTQIARAQGLQGKFEEAHKTLDLVEKKLTDDLKIAKIRYLLERGRVFNSSGKKDKAKPFFIQAWDYGVKNKLDLYAIDAAHMMAIVEPPEKQIDWSEKAIDLVEKSDDKRVKGWLGPLYNNTGWTYHDLGKYQEAMVLFKKSLKYREKIKDAQGTFIAKWTIARCYRSLERYDEALEIQLALEKEITEKNLPTDGYVFEELGELYLIKEDKENSKKYFKKAYEELSKDDWLQKNEPDRLKRIKQLATENPEEK